MAEHRTDFSNSYKMDYNNKIYVLAYKINNIWNLSNKLFMLNYDDNNDILSGQFISSSWFSQNIIYNNELNKNKNMNSNIINNDKNIELAVIELDKNNMEDKKKLLKKLNDNSYDIYDIDNNIIILKELDYYLIEKYYKENKENNKDNKNIKDIGCILKLNSLDNNNNIIYVRLKVRENNNELIVNLSLPEFIYHLN